MTVVVVSIDAVAPRYVTPETMPNLVAFGRSGAACYQARTVNPPITMPAHISLLRGVDPSVHGVVDNREIDIAPPAADVPTFLEVVRRSGVGGTASVVSWAPMDAAVERGAVSTRMLIDDGYNPAVDATIVDRIRELLADGTHAAIYGYLIAPDLAGHDHGWGSEQYLAALGGADGEFGRLAAACGPEDSLLVTTDHGGLGTDHGYNRPEDMETFVALRSPKVEAGSVWSSASILDLCPTVADLLAVEPHPRWQGQSLLGRERPLAAVLLDLLDEMDRYTYGERVTMLDHSLQTAANARAAGASDALTAAALLHDVGHLWGDSGPWGLPDHAEVAGRALQALLDPAVVEPIRLHVAAKRWLVANDPAYRDQLSEASQITLEQQGGPFTTEESAAFLGQPFASEAISLRRWDDGGKRVAPSTVVFDLADAGPLLDSVTAMATPTATATADIVSAAWARDACRCPACRDQRNDQHLLTASDLDGWSTISVDRTTDPAVVEIRRGDDSHRCTIPLNVWDPALNSAASDHRWDAERIRATDNVWLEHGSDAWADRVAEAVARHGLAVLRGVPTEPGTVLRVAADLGFVRVTNYGDLFEVRNEPQPENLAYTSIGLPLHTDNPYRDPCPTVQLLHCLQPAEEGGASVLADGFEAAARLRADDPTAFATLASTLVRFRFHTIGDGGEANDANGNGVDLQARRAILEVDPTGQVVAVNVNHRSMEAPAPSSDVDEFYRAYGRFCRLLDEPGLALELTLAAGELIVFDNRRVLHARTAFDTSSARHLQGCYIDIDALRSRARVRRSATGSR